jgi:hypothetical protein
VFRFTDCYFMVLRYKGNSLQTIIRVNSSDKGDITNGLKLGIKVLLKFEPNGFITH